MIARLIMSISILGSICFGEATMMMLLNIHISHMSKRNKAIFFISTLMVLFVNFAVVFFLGEEQQTIYYMLLVHLPLAVLFWKITKIHPIKILFTLFTAVFLIFPATLTSSLIARCMPRPFKALSIVVLFAAFFGIFLFVDKFLKKDFHYLIEQYSNRSFLKLFLLPFVYNIATFWVGKYNYGAETTAENLIMRGMLFVLTFTAYLLVLDISRSDMEKQTMLHNQDILSLQLESASQQMEFLHTTQEQTVMYRHDMRHHLALLSGFAAEGDLEKINEYLSQTELDINAITPTRYCENETANMILSSFESMAENKGVTLHLDIKLPQEMGINNTEFCSLLSNALENAITAAAEVKNENLRKVRVCAFIKENKLIVAVENPYVGELEMDGDIPKAQKSRVGHGFGIKSMVAIVEHHNGLYSFKTADGIFVLELILPLDNKRALV